MRAAGVTAFGSRFWFICILGVMAIAELELAMAKNAQPDDTPPALTLEAQPNEVTLDMRRQPHGQLLVLARNPKATKLDFAELSFVPVTGLTTTIVNKPPPPLADDLVWTVDVAADETAALPAKLVVQLRYKAAGPNAGPRTLVTTIGIAAPSVPTIASLKTTLLPADGVVEEDTPLDTTLQIDNTTRQTVHIKDIVLLAPANYLRFSRAPPSMAEIAPSGSLAIPLQITVGAASPGTYSLVIGYNAAFASRPAEWLPATAQGKIGIEVRGVSDTLQFLNVGSVLLLPGVLAVLTFITFYAWLSGNAPLDWKNPFLLVVSVMLSYLAAKFYPWLTAHWLGQRRDFFHAYQMQDVVYVWVGSVAIGASVGLVTGGSISGYRWWRSRREPDLADRPINVLCKLARLHHDFWMRAVQRDPAGGDAAAQLMLVLPFGTAGAGRRWIVQRARLAEGTALGAAGRMMTIRGLLGHHGTAIQTRMLLRQVQQGLDAGQITLEWERNANIGPVEVADTDHPNPVGPRAFLTE
jgi:hypothetical protein